MTMNDSVVILGRQPTLGIAELESLYGSTALQPLGDFGVTIHLPTDEIDFNRLGGAVKLCKLLTVLDTTNWGQVERYLAKVAPEHAAYLPEGKMQLGISVYGSQESAQRIMATGLSVKKAIKKSGRSVRLTPNQEPALSSAQVAHNHLTGPTGWELIIIQHDDKTVVAQTVAVQDIDGYTLRDRGRPKRDTRVGMLPPKLAQIIINLAVAENSEQKTKSKLTVLDPFCGTGVILQEALLMGYSVYGTDLEPRMIDYTGENLDWLDTQFQLLPTECRFEQGDAISYKWEPTPDIVASETYLGRPFTSVPDNATLAQTVTDCNQIIRKFLRNIGTQTKPGTRLCIAVPAWQTRPGQFKHLPVVDSLEEIGYNRLRFEHVREEDLLYFREDQIVARELLVVIRK